ncbi:MAG: VWA domain-containing protein [Phycisphaerales bacterium]|nr:MAG: VWA domain-containing protein [Phycisphaerales bacterium]
MDLRFNHLEQLHWLWAVVLLAGLMIWGLAARHRAMLRFASHNLIGHLVGSSGTGRAWFKGVLLILALISLVAALLDPRWGVRYEDVQQRGIDIVIALDASRSMLGEDVTPNRLERAKQFAGDLVAQLHGDRVGLITFAGTASIKCPLTVDYGAFRLSLAEVGPQSAARGGSLLGDAIRKAADAFTDEIPDYKALVILTDGEDHDSYPVEAARQLLEQRGVKIYTVGIGDSSQGARIPIEQDGRRIYLTYDDQEVWSKMDINLLREVALAGGGAFIPVGTRSVDLGQIYEERIAPAAKREFETSRIRLYNAQYQWFAGLALALLMLEMIIGSRRSRPDLPSNRKAVMIR